MIINYKIDNDETEHASGASGVLLQNMKKKKLNALSTTSLLTKGQISPNHGRARSPLLGYL